MWKDSETNVDLLEFDYLINTAQKIIEDEKLSPSTIGVYGDWGSGKSSLVDMILNSYSGKEGYLCIKFNGWLFEDYEDAKIALIGTILDKIKSEQKLVGKAKEYFKKLAKNIDYMELAGKGIKYGIDFFATGGMGTLADLTIGTVAKKLQTAGSSLEAKQIEKVLNDTFKKEKDRKNLKEFQENFENLLKETNIKRLVVFIDELDRCHHDTILETLEAIRLFLFTKGTSFIIGADERQVMYAVRSRYPEVIGNQIDIGKEFLEKMIQYPIKIPILGEKEVETYITCLLLEKEIPKEYQKIIEIIKKKKIENFMNFEINYGVFEEESISVENKEKIKEILALAKQLSSVLAINLNGNPRHCKRFLNSLYMRLDMADFKKIVLDKKVLAKIMLIEYFKEEVFKKIGTLQAAEKGKPKEIDLIEQGKWDEVESLKLWKDDDWFITWCKNEPKLKDTDLSPYYYFTRESLHNHSFKKSLGISTEAEEIIKDLISESEIKSTAALKKATNISDFEANEILKSVFEIIQKESKINPKLFYCFIEWGLTRETLYINVISMLQSIPTNRITAGLVPHIESFKKVSGKTVEIDELISNWIKENSKLGKLFKN